MTIQMKLIKRIATFIVLLTYTIQTPLAYGMRRGGEVPELSIYSDGDSPHSQSQRLLDIEPLLRASEPLLEDGDDIDLQDLDDDRGPGVFFSDSDEDGDDHGPVTIGQEQSLYSLAFKRDRDRILSKFTKFKYFICLVGAVGPIIPQIAIPLTVGDEYNSSFLGYALAGATVLYIEGVASWLIWELISDGEKLVKAARIQKNTRGTCSFGFIKEVGVGILALTLGAMSSIPDVYKAYKYNKIKEFAIISFIYDTIPHTIGFYKFFSSIDTEKLKRPCSQKSKELLNALRILDISRLFFLKKCREDGVNNVEYVLTTSNTSDEIYNVLTTDMPAHLLMVASPEQFKRGVPRNIVRYLAIIPPFATMASLSMVFAYNGWGLLFDHKPARIVLSTISVLPAFVLNTFVITRVAGNLFDRIYLWKKGFPTPGYFPNFYPKTNKVFIGTALTLASAISISGFFLISENLHGTILEPYKYIFTTLAVGTDLTFGGNLIYSTIIRYGEALVSKVSSTGSFVLNCLKKLNFLESEIVESSPASLQDVTQHMPQEPQGYGTTSKGVIISFWAR